MRKPYLVIHPSLETQARDLFGNQFELVFSEDLSLPQKTFDQKSSFEHIKNKTSKKRYYYQKSKK